MCTRLWLSRSGLAARTWLFSGPGDQRRTSGLWPPLVAQEATGLFLADTCLGNQAMLG